MIIMSCKFVLIHVTSLCYEQADQKTEAWKIEESRRRAIGADYAKSLGLQQAEFEKSKGRWMFR